MRNSAQGSVTAARRTYDPGMSEPKSFNEAEPRRDSAEWLVWGGRFLDHNPTEFATRATSLRKDDRRSYDRLMKHVHAELRRDLHDEFGLLSVPVRGFIWTTAISHALRRSVGRLAGLA